jgi:ABC-type nitrate/sulfonate/bicarbonate transport system substrate-binding protein
MKVGRDYKVIQFQGEPERIAALTNGDIAAALVSVPRAYQARQAGFNVLLRTGDYLPQPAARSGAPTIISGRIPTPW